MVAVAQTDADALSKVASRCGYVMVPRPPQIQYGGEETFKTISFMSTLMLRKASCPME